MMKNKKKALLVLFTSILGFSCFIFLENEHAKAKVVGNMSSIKTVKTSYYTFTDKKKGSKYVLVLSGGKVSKGKQTITKETKKYKLYDTSTWVISKTAKYKKGKKSYSMVYGYDYLNSSQKGWMYTTDVKKAKSNPIGKLTSIKNIAKTYYDFNAKKKSNKYAVIFSGGKVNRSSQVINKETKKYKFSDTSMWVGTKTATFTKGKKKYSVVYAYDRQNSSHKGWFYSSDMELVKPKTAKTTTGADENATKLFIPKQIINVKDNDIANLVGDGSQDDSANLKTLFEYTKSHPYTKLYFPKGDYSISPTGNNLAGWNDRVMIQIYSNTIVDMDANARIVVKNRQGFTFYSAPTAKGYDGGIKNFHWKGGKMVRTDNIDSGSIPIIYTLFSLVHAQNISFENTIYDGIQNVSGHNYDLVGCKNVAIKNNFYYGYGFTKNIQPEIGNNSGLHPFYSEIIELDYPYAPGKVGNFSAFGLEVWNSFSKTQQDYANDFIPCRKITVEGNKISPKKDSKGNIISYSQNLIGSHVKATNLSQSKKTGDILIKGNTIENPCPVKPTTYTFNKKKVTATVEWNGIMHFTEADKITIDSNTIKINAPGISKRTSLFSFYDSNSSKDYCDGVVVKNNKISGAKNQYSKAIQWGGVGKQLLEIESNVYGWK